MVEKECKALNDLEKKCASRDRQEGVPVWAGTQQSTRSASPFLSSLHHLHQQPDDAGDGVEQAGLIMACHCVFDNEEESGGERVF